MEINLNREKHTSKHHTSPFCGVLQFIQLFHWLHLFLFPSDPKLLRTINRLINRASCKEHLSPVCLGVPTEMTWGLGGQNERFLFCNSAEG